MCGIDDHCLSCKKCETDEGKAESVLSDLLSSFDRDVLKSARQNHIWLNAFNCVTPTVEFRLHLADIILHWLDDKDYLIYDHQDSEIEAMREIGKLTPQLVLRINKS